MTTLAIAALERLGEKSPIHELSQNKYLLIDVANILKERETNFIMVCGGYDFSHTIKSTEIFDIQKNSWIPGVDLPEERDSCSTAIVDDGRIFVIGGRLGSSPTNTVIALSADKSSWEKMPKMKESRYCPGVAVVDEMIFVFGGCGNNYQRICEVYSVKKTPGFR